VRSSKAAQKRSKRSGADNPDEIFGISALQRGAIVGSAFVRQHTFQVASAIATLLSVAAVFISPAVDLERAAMRASRASELAFLALATAATVLADLCSGAALEDGSVHVAPRFNPGHDLSDLICSRLWLDVLKTALFRKQQVLLPVRKQKQFPVRRARVWKFPEEHFSKPVWRAALA
jgi:hypothetical protein